MNRRSILTIITIIISLSFIWESNHRFSLLLAFIHSIIIINSSYRIFSKEDVYFSFYKMFHLFTLFFAGIAPIAQFNNDTAMWGCPHLTEYDYLNTSFTYLISIIIFDVIYNVRYRNTIIKENRFKKFVEDTGDLNLNFKSITLIIFASLFSFYMIFRLNNFNLFSLLIRGGDFKDTMAVSKMESLLIMNFFQPMNMVLFLFIFNFSKSKILKFFLLSMAVLSAAPTAIPRFTAASLYLPVLLSFAFFRRKNVFILSFVAALLLLFPAMTVFRYNEDFKLSFFDSSIFTDVDFDSYFIFATIQKYDVITHGSQLLGSLFFWLPRAMWIDKPYGSGQLVGEMLHLPMTNLSCNFFGEGYVNFGFIGIVIFTIVVAQVIAYVDKYYWALNTDYKNMSYFSLLYFIVGTTLFLFFRGDMMCSTAYICGNIVTYLFIRRFVFSK